MAEREFDRSFRYWANWPLSMISTLACLLRVILIVISSSARGIIDLHWDANIGFIGPKIFGKSRHRISKFLDRAAGVVSPKSGVSALAPIPRRYLTVAVFCVLTARRSGVWPSTSCSLGFESSKSCNIFRVWSSLASVATARWSGVWPDVFFVFRHFPAPESRSIVNISTFSEATAARKIDQLSSAFDSTSDDALIFSKGYVDILIQGASS